LEQYPLKTMRFLPILLALAVCPSIHSQIVVGSAGVYRPEQPLCAGAWAAAVGNFAGVTATTESSDPLPKTIAGVSVTVDGIAAPMNFAGPTQVNFIIPYGVTPGVRPVQVRTPTTTISGLVRLISAAPAIFPKDAATPPRGAIRHVDGSENSSSNPIRRGQFIVIYGTGPGALSQAPADGAGAPSNPPVTTRSTPQVYIGGIPAETNFSGLTPGLAGVWQINALVPDRPFLNGRVPIRVFMDGVDANEVTVFVAQ
jgi:uncharacterized protein (TIGR03437 family)